MTIHQTKKLSLDTEKTEILKPFFSCPLLLPLFSFLLSVFLFPLPRRLLCRLPITLLSSLFALLVTALLSANTSPSVTAVGSPSIGFLLEMLKSSILLPCRLFPNPDKPKPQFCHFAQVFFGKWPNLLSFHLLPRPLSAS